MADKAVGTESYQRYEKKEYKGKKLRVALIGCGGIAQTHMKAYQQIPEVEIVAGVDIDPKRNAFMQSNWAIEKTYTDWKKMLKEVQPDAVDICTPNGVHCAPAVDASRAGCHVITEKPMGMTPRECQQMIDAAKKAGKLLTIGFQFRYHPSTEYLVRARDEGQFGDIMFMKCLSLRRRGIPNWGVFGQKKLQGGGPMIDIGVHILETAHFILGSPKPVAASGNVWTYLGNKPSSVISRWADWDYKTYTVEDLAIGQIRFDNGAILQIEAAFAAHLKEDLFNLNFMGTKGGGNWDPATIYTDRHGTMVDETPHWLPPTDFGALFIRKLQNWVDGCLKGTPLTAPGEAGLVVQKMLDGVYRSAEAGKEVKIS